MAEDKLAILKRLRDRAEELRNEASKSQGAYEANLARLSKEYKCSNPKQAAILLEALHAEETKAQAEFEEKLAQYQREWENS